MTSRIIMAVVLSLAGLYWAGWGAFFMLFAFWMVIFISEYAAEQRAEKQQLRNEIDRLRILTGEPGVVGSEKDESDGDGCERDSEGESVEDALHALVRKDRAHRTGRAKRRHAARQ